MNSAMIKQVSNMRHKNIYVLALMLLLSGSLMAQVRIGGSVYGGCELGKVTGNTEVARVLLPTSKTARATSWFLPRRPAG